MSRLQIYKDRSRYWKNSNNQLHRKNGPAVEYPNGDKSWYLNGKNHRDDGPAIDWADGYKEWRINGKEYTEAEFKELIQG